MSELIERLNAAAEGREPRIAHIYKILHEAATALTAANKLAESRLSEIKRLTNQSESLARTVMADQVSNDYATEKRGEDIFTLWKVTMPSGESCYCGMHSLAKAIARTSGTIQLARIPRKDFNLLKAADFDATPSMRATASEQLADERRVEIERLQMIDALRTGSRIAMLKDAAVTKEYYDWLGKEPQKYRESLGGNEVWNAAYKMGAEAAEQSLARAEVDARSKRAAERRNIQLAGMNLLSEKEVEYWQDALTKVQADGSVVLPPGSNVLCRMAMATAIDAATTPKPAPYQFENGDVPR